MNSPAVMSNRAFPAGEFIEKLFNPEFNPDFSKYQSVLPHDAPPVLCEIAEDDPQILEELAGYIRDSQEWVIRRIFELLFSTGSRPRYVAMNAFCLARLFSPSVFGENTPSYEDLCKFFDVKSRAFFCSRSRKLCEKLVADSLAQGVALPPNFSLFLSDAGYHKSYEKGGQE